MVRDPPEDPSSNVKGESVEELADKGVDEAGEIRGDKVEVTSRHGKENKSTFNFSKLFTKPLLLLSPRPSTTTLLSTPLFYFFFRFSSAAFFGTIACSSIRA